MNDRTDSPAPRRRLDPEKFLARVRERRERMAALPLTPDELRASNDEDLERRSRVALGEQRVCDEAPRGG